MQHPQRTGRNHTVRWIASAMYTQANAHKPPSPPNTPESPSRPIALPPSGVRCAGRCGRYMGRTLRTKCDEWKAWYRDPRHGCVGHGIVGAPFCSFTSCTVVKMMVLDTAHCLFMDGAGSHFVVGQHYLSPSSSSDIAPLVVARGCRHLTLRSVDCCVTALAPSN